MSKAADYVKTAKDSNGEWLLPGDRVLRGSSNAEWYVLYLFNRPGQVRTVARLIRPDPDAKRSFLLATEEAVELRLEKKAAALCVRGDTREQIYPDGDRYTYFAIKLPKMPLCIHAGCQWWMEGFSEARLYYKDYGDDKKRDASLPILKRLQKKYRKARDRANS